MPPDPAFACFRLELYAILRPDGDFGAGEGAS
jgi:hypothetical protein